MKQDFKTDIDRLRKKILLYTKSIFLRAKVNSISLGSYQYYSSSGIRVFLDEVILKDEELVVISHDIDYKEKVLALSLYSIDDMVIIYDALYNSQKS